MKLPKIAIAGFIILALLAVLFFVKRNPSSTGGLQTPSTTSETTKDTLANLLTQNGSVKCEYSYTPKDGEKTSGKMYVSNGMMNGEFKTMMNGKESLVYMINDGTYSYTWGTGMPEGIKFKNPTEITGQPVSNESNKYVDLNQQYDYKCSSWSKDNGKFAPPTDVKFNDVSSMMKQTQDKNGMMKQTQCATCDSLSGDAQTQCKTTLGCN